ncbi:hypothetical protein R1sor_023170 [Riccia sorocarpa]|uniref:Uncharacterized protein n=1 Tax=Riccia sorocarpa TaxID=122646 RepID=A0ABD3GR30_9MARC
MMCSLSPEVSPTGKEQRSILKQQRSLVHFSSGPSGSPSQQQNRVQFSNEAAFSPSRHRGRTSSTLTRGQLSALDRIEVSRGHHYNASSEDDMDAATPRVDPGGGAYIDASAFFDSGRRTSIHASEDPHYRARSQIDMDTANPGFGGGPRGGPYVDTTSFYEPRRSASNLDYEEDEPEEPFDEDGPGGNPVIGESKQFKRKKAKKAPEQQITIFALRLALIEKGASGLGALAFLWATVVILGGFASTVNGTDFWVVTLIILAESSRIFSRSHELEWQQLSVRSHESVVRRFLRINPLIRVKKSKAVGGTSVKRAVEVVSSSAPASSSPQSFQKLKVEKPAAAVYQTEIEESRTKDQTRTWNAPSLQIVPYTHHLVTTRLISRLLYAVQLLSAMMCIALAIWRLWSQDFFHIVDIDQPKLPNLLVSMNVFYILSAVEAGLFLVERSYWEYKIRVQQLLQSVNEDAELRPENYEAVKQFFYDVYSKCLEGSVFDGLKMDLVSFGISWLQADDFKQQLGGARLLNGIVSDDESNRRTDHFADECLRRIGTTPGIIERLVEMLSWNSIHEQPLLTEVAAIICRLVVYNRNCSRIVAIPGSIEGITNLLVPREWPNPKNNLHCLEQTKAYLELRLNGLRILKYLCKDHKNCLRIGEAKGLLSILIFFVEVRNKRAFEVSGKDFGSRKGNGRDSSKDPDQDKDFFSYRLKKYKKSLQVISLLAATTNTSGKILRSRIAAVVSGLKNLRDMIQFGNSQPVLQRLSVEILFHLAMDSAVRNTIGATGGIVRNLYDLFTSYNQVASAAGKPSSGPSTISQDSKSRRESEERQLASEMAGKTLTRIVLQNEKNCLKLVYIEGDSPKPFLKCMIDFLMKPLNKPADTATAIADEEIASCSAQILRSVIPYVTDEVKSQVAQDSAHIVLQLLQQRFYGQRSLLYESYLGLAPRIIEHLDLETYLPLIDCVITKEEVVDLILKDLKHTPSTIKYPNIRRSVNLTSVLHDTLESISEVENFCLFSGLIGYAKQSEEMEPLVKRAIELVEIVRRRLAAENLP